MTSADEIYAKQPLLAFSPYTAVQVDALERVGDRLNHISTKWRGGQIEDFQEYHGMFWLWVLGAYEVLRTMHQHAPSFSSAKQGEIGRLKIKLAKLRMPFAKQELRGDKPIYGELSVVDFERGEAFNIGGELYHSEDLIAEVSSFFRSFSADDINTPGPANHPWQP